MKKRKSRVFYSTNPDYEYIDPNQEEVETIPKEEQRLRVSIEKKGRGGKTVTLIKGFIGTDDDLKDLGKKMKSKCGTGGSAKDSLILLQGDFKLKAIEILKDFGFKDVK